MQPSLAQVLAALAHLRAPVVMGEYDLHALTAQALTSAGIPFEHEAMLAPRCRIDFLALGVGIEVKKGKPERKRLLSQMTRYAKSERVQALVVLAERSADMPREVLGKPCALVCANRMWGIAL